MISGRSYDQRLRRSLSRGFTIVELLIVVVVIAILAAITVVYFRGVQARSSDSVRMNDIATIRKALELYKVEHGRYPNAVPNPGLASWEVSVDPDFLQSVASYVKVIPSDPKNTTSSYYAYYRSAAGAYGCPAAAGAFYVLRVTRLEALDGRDVSDLGPCASSTSLSETRTPTADQAVFFGFEGQS